MNCYIVLGTCLSSKMEQGWYAQSRQYYNRHEKLRPEKRAYCRE